jgi:hypothetical protein
MKPISFLLLRFLSLMSILLLALGNSARADVTGRWACNFYFNETAYPQDL